MVWSAVTLPKVVCARLLALDLQCLEPSALQPFTTTAGRLEVT